jgi:hypothetical protein
MPKYFWDLIAANNLPNLLLFVVGVAGTIIAVRTLKKIERQTKAAEVSSKAQMDADRGWVLASVSGQPLEPMTKHLMEKGVHPGIVWKLQIFGNTPVRIIRTDFRCRIVDTDPDVASRPGLAREPVYFPNNTPEGRVVYPPGDTPMHFSISLENLVDPQPNVTLVDRLTQLPIGAGFLVSYGRVEYEDAFKRKGVTQFCAIYRPHRGGVITSPDGTVLNPVGFHIDGPAGYNFNT